jgi:glycosyltransferase involved in cell wall biosynthesis
VSDPTVSVIIPTYNYGRYIRDALESVFAQTYSDYEIIIVDDGSTDGTPEIVAPYLDRVKLISTDHEGHTAARDVGVAASRGRYICFLDSDDKYTPDKLELQVPFLETHPDFDFVFSDFSSFNETGVHTESFMAERKRFLRLPYRREGAHRVFLTSLYEAFFYERFILPGTMLARRDYVIETGVYDRSLGAKVYTSKLLHTLDRAKVAYTDAVTVCRRWHGENISQNNELVYTSILQLYEKFLRTRGHEMPAAYRRFSERRMSDAHYRLALAAIDRSDIGQGRSHFWQSLKMWPLKWRALAGLAASFLPKPATGERNTERAAI